MLPDDDPTNLRLNRPVATFRTVTPGYFRTMGIQLRAGRFLQEAETRGAIVVSEALVRALWPKTPIADAVGQRVRALGAREEQYLIVGVVGEVKMGSLDGKPVPQVYWSHAQVPMGTMNIVMRTALDPLGVSPVVRDAIRAVDSTVPIPTMKTMAEIVSASVAQRRFQLFLILFFAGLALVLALFGVYGVISYSVARQTAEIGLRMAIGAVPAQIVRTMLLRSLMPVALGLILGLAVATAGIPVLRSLLFGVSPTDPSTLFAVICLVGVTSSLACYVPARRAARLDPVSALRYD
jgi:putative ABC transport system permease protein